MEFLSIKADLKNNLFENTKYIPFVLELLLKNKQLLLDDYLPKNDSQLIDFIIKEINSIYPWFIVGISNEEAVGAAWITHWHYPHSCQIHACIDKKFWGKPALFAMEELLIFLKQKTGIIRAQMEIPEFNKTAINYAKKAKFIEEGLINCATFKNDKPLNHVLLARILN